jgi:hypothetical protein
MAKLNLPRVAATAAHPIVDSGTRLRVHLTSAMRGRRWIWLAGPGHVWSAGDVNDRALAGANWHGSSVPSVSGHC